MKRNTHVIVPARRFRITAGAGNLATYRVSGRRPRPSFFISFCLCGGTWPRGARAQAQQVAPLPLISGRPVPVL